jgi:4a-hydroxytetrahydrobiopterin dehydratase
MSDLMNMKCVPCRGGEPPLTEGQIEEFRTQLADWEVLEREGIKRLQRTFKFKDFREALAFTDRVGGLAESEGHHPAILTEYGKVTVTWWTHKIRGLHQNDFIMSAKTAEIYAHRG